MKEPTAVFDPSDLPIPTRDLRTLVVRPIYASERERWDSLMREHHSLEFGWFAGKSIKHVAFLDGEWVALLGWGTSAVKVSSRDTWNTQIGLSFAGRHSSTGPSWK